MKKKENETKPIFDEFTLNQNGVKIKKCCASCASHEPYDANGPRRLCTLSKKIVQKDDLCGCWHISIEIDRIKTNSNGA